MGNDKFQCSVRNTLQNATGFIGLMYAIYVGAMYYKGMNIPLFSHFCTSNNTLFSLAASSLPRNEGLHFIFQFIDADR